MKTMDAGRAEMEIAAKAGANVASSSARPPTPPSASASRRPQLRLQVGVDLIGVADPVARAPAPRSWASTRWTSTRPSTSRCGARRRSTCCGRCRGGRDPGAVAGGINSRDRRRRRRGRRRHPHRRRRHHQGGRPRRRPPAEIAAPCDTRVRVETELYKRAGAETSATVLEQVSTANISDGTHRAPCLAGIRPAAPGAQDVRPGRHRAHLRRATGPSPSRPSTSPSPAT